jgi:hypothetical protein
MNTLSLQSSTNISISGQTHQVGSIYQNGSSGNSNHFSSGKEVCKKAYLLSVVHLPLVVLALADALLISSQSVQRKHLL